ncbi:MAG: Ger(x)C family spore germination protein [Bacillus sp. (in: firmicutes)]
MNMHVFPKLVKMILLLFFCMNCLFLTGCWDRREVFDMAIVLGTAVDKTGENEIEVTLQVLVPKAVGGEAAGSQASDGNVVIVRSEKGKNIADATSNLEMQLSRNIFWGHCKMFIFGESLAKENGIRKELDFLTRHPQPRERAYIYIAEGNAKKFLKEAPSLELYVGEGMRKMIEKKIVVKKTIKDVEEMLTSDSPSVILPYLKLLKNSNEKNQQIMTIYEAVVLDRDKMVRVINNSEMRGLLWIRNETKVNSITVPLEGQEYVSVRVVEGTTKLTPSIKNGKWKIDINVSMQCAVIQNETNLDMMSPKIIEKLEKAVGKMTKSKIDDALQVIQDDIQVDALGFADAFHKKYPKEWEKMKGSWNEFLPEISISTKVQADVLRAGLTTLPAGLKKEEVKK